jgi:hypothetical protein
MKDEDNCDPAYGTDWADTDIMSVMGAAKAGIPGAVAQLEKWEKELLLSAIDPISTDKSADITKNNPNRDPRTGQFTYGAGGPQSGGSGGAGGTEAETEEATDYRGYHTAPRREDGFGAPATDIEEMMPDFYERPNIYTTGMPEADKESVSALMRIKGKPDAPVTIYRAVPKGADEINPGDWVTLSPTYAKQHLMSNLEAGHVISQVIPASDLWFDGDSINEFGYDPVSKGKSADITKNNPNRDPRTGQFTFGAGGPQSGGVGGGEVGTDAESLKEEALKRAESGKEIDVTEFAEAPRSYEADNAKMGEVIKEQGWSKPALVADPEEYEKLKASGDFIEVHRGGPKGTTDGLTSGDPWIGDGNAGPGTYVTTDIERATAFASLSKMQTGDSEVTTALIPKTMLEKAPGFSSSPENPLPSKWSGKKRADYVVVAANGNGAYESSYESSADGDYVIYNTSAMVIKGS